MKGWMCVTQRFQNCFPKIRSWSICIDLSSWNLARNKCCIVRKETPHFVNVSNNRSIRGKKVSLFLRLSWVSLSFFLYSCTNLYLSRYDSCHDSFSIQFLILQSDFYISPRIFRDKERNGGWMETPNNKKGTPRTIFFVYLSFTKFLDLARYFCSLHEF